MYSAVLFMEFKVPYSTSPPKKRSSMTKVGRAFAQVVKGLTGAVEVVEADELAGTEEVTGTEEVASVEELDGVEEVTGTEEVAGVEELDGVEVKGTQTRETTGNS